MLRNKAVFSPEAVIFNLKCLQI